MTTTDAAGALLTCRSLCPRCLLPMWCFMLMTFLLDRCTTESSLSDELLSRLTAVPKMRTVLQQLPPKMILISSDKPDVVIDQKVEHDSLETRVDDVVHRIMNSTFTGKGDMVKVPRMYKDYVTRIAEMLQKTLAFAAAGGDSSSQP